jgi:hypothetical protein
MDKHNAHDPNEARPKDAPRKGNDDSDKAIKPNPPRTTKGGITAPKFGSAGSGGAELEPGPERD